MHLSVYADLDRTLTTEERSRLFDSVERLIPGSGCVGNQRGPGDELYFSVEAPTRAEAERLAASYIRAAMKDAGLELEFRLTLQPSSDSAD